jgi:hypothetical protein
MARILQLAILAACLLGCSSRNPDETSPSASPSVLDQLLMPEAVFVRVREAEREFPADVWETHPKIGHFNHSRSTREMNLAQELLATIRPHLAKMLPRELLDSLKTFPYPEYASFSGVSYYIYRDGNQMIINELASRSTSEVQSLDRFRDVRDPVFTGDSGPPLSVGDLVRYKLLHESLH